MALSSTAALSELKSLRERGTSKVSLPLVSHILFAGFPGMGLFSNCSSTTNTFWRRCSVASGSESEKLGRRQHAPELPRPGRSRPCGAAQQQAGARPRRAVAHPAPQSCPVATEEAQPLRAPASAACVHLKQVPQPEGAQHNQRHKWQARAQQRVLPHTPSSERHRRV